MSSCLSSGTWTFMLLSFIFALFCISHFPSGACNKMLYVHLLIQLSSCSLACCKTMSFAKSKIRENIPKQIYSKHGSRVCLAPWPQYVILLLHYIPSVTTCSPLPKYIYLARRVYYNQVMFTMIGHAIFLRLRNNCLC